MKRLRKLITTSLIMASIMSISSIEASAEWKTDSKGWWYADGSSWSVGWKQIDSKWYYFNSDGYMAHNTTVDGYKLGLDGAWMQDTAGVFYVGTDLVPMNTTSFSGNGYCSYSNKYKTSHDTMVDNLNNTYDNYIRLSCFDGGDNSRIGDGVQFVYTEIPLQKQFKKFKSLVGIGQYSKDYLESAVVKVYLDDKVAYSKQFKSGDMLDNIELDITGKTKIKFAVENIKGKDGMGNTQVFGFFNPQFIK